MTQMKKTAVFIAGLLLVGLFASCGAGVPTKEMEDAKTSIERARSMDAPVFAAQDFMDAENDFQLATNFILSNQNKEAKEKADSSKVKADKSYDTAREKRAEDMVQKCAALMDTADKNFADKLMPESYQECKTGFDYLKTLYEKKDWDTTYTNGADLKPKLENLAGDAKTRVDRVKNAIAQAQDKYDAAESKDIVKEYALNDLKKALPLLQEARDKYNAVDLNGAEQKARDAEAAIDEAERIAREAYDKAMKQKSDTNNISLDKQKEVELQKKKANEFIDEAKKKLDQLKKLNKSGGLKFKISTEPFVYYITGFKLIAQNMSSDSVIEPPANTNQNEEISMASVQRYISLAEEAYKNEEYLDSIDYAREAIRIADILLAGESFATYEVKLRPENRDCLWKISGYMYENRTWLWPVIWRANKYQIQDPDMIYPGQKLKIPPVLGD